VVDTAKLVARVETKGVKRATDELDRFSDEAKDAEKSSVNLGKAAKAAAGFIVKAGASIGAAGAALTAIAIKASDAQKEWQNLSKVAGDSVDTFKASAFAANQVGISAEKLADISKDTNEKLGEFIATGGGGFADFFNQVAPQVGLTAEELQGLSGPQVLGRVQKAFEQANVPIEQQSFYLESIASDTTALIPLLKNEGEELNRLTNRYNELNESLQLTGAAEAGLRELSTNFDLLQQTAGNALNLITSQFAPDIAKFVNFITTSIPKATQSVIDFFDEFRDPENRRSISSIQETIAENLEEIQELQENTARRGKNIRAAQKKALEQENEELKKRIDLLKEERQIVESPAFSTSGSSVKTNTQKEKEKQQKDSLERQKKLKEEFDEAELQSQQDFESKREDTISKGFDNVISLSSSKNRDLFNLSKGAAVANAILSSQETIANAFAVKPYPLGVALGVAAIGSTAARVDAIRNTQPPSAREQGGQFARGQDLLVGEKGPELVRFNAGGRIANTQDTQGLLNGGMAPNVIINNNAAGTVATAETLSTGDVVVIVEQVLNREVNKPNSNFNKSLDRTRNAPRTRNVG